MVGQLIQSGRKLMRILHRLPKPQALLDLARVGGASVNVMKNGVGIFSFINQMKELHP